MIRKVNSALAGCIALATLQPTQSLAVEGGIGAYFMGTRDTLAGIVPPPGDYLAFTYDRLSGTVQGLSVGGLPIAADAEIDLNLVRLGYTRVFDAELWGGTPAFNVTVPLLDASLSFVGVTPPVTGLSVADETSGIGDVSFTGLVGWHRETLHYNVGMTVYTPSASYSLASIDIPNQTINALSNSKNVWTFQPTIAATYLNPQTGFEVSGAASLLFSTKNDATDYQTGAAVQLESAVVQRLPSGWGFGLTGYYYQQIEDDSGTGADNLRTTLGADSLKARVYGAGPIVTYSGGKLFGGDLSLKLKYVTEFGAKRRLESDVFTFSLSLAY